MSQTDIETLRRFNRSFTRRMGVLDERFLGRDRSVGAARFLFEIGPDTCEVSDLRERLGLDSGYASRLLRQLEDEGLVEMTPGLRDRRRRIASLTAAGRAEWQLLDDLSNELASRVLAPLSDGQKRKLTESLVRAERLLSVMSVTFAVVDPLSSEAVACINSYFEELDRRFPNGFDPLGAPEVDAPQFTPPVGRFLVGRHEALAVACGGIQTLQSGVGEIKRMWVAESWRGVGIGPRLLEELESHSLDLGLRTVRLDTNPVLLEAVALYERSGYRPIGRYNDNPYAGHWFEKTLTPGRHPVPAE